MQMVWLKYLFCSINVDMLNKLSEDVANCITNSGRSFFWRGKLTQLLYRKEVRKQTIMCTCFLYSLIFFPSVEIFLQWCCFSNSIFEHHYLSKHFNHYSWHAANTETFIQMFPSYCMSRQHTYPVFSTHRENHV